MKKILLDLGTSKTPAKGIKSNPIIDLVSAKVKKLEHEAGDFTNTNHICSIFFHYFIL